MKLPAALLAAAIFAAAASAVGPSMKHTTAGTSAAKASLLTLKDLGKGWTSSATTATGLNLSCPGYVPSGKGVVETGGAASPAFKAGQVGPFVFQQTSVYGSVAQASTLWGRAVKPALITCVTQTVKSLASNGVKVAITSQGTLAFTKVATHTQAFRVVASVSASKVTYKRTLYFDVILIGSGSALTEITLTSYVKPVPANVELALARLVARRITLPTA